MKWAQDMEISAAQSREVLEEENPRKWKTFQEICHAGGNRRQKTEGFHEELNAENKVYLIM